MELLEGTEFFLRILLVFVYFYVLVNPIHAKLHPWQQRGYLGPCRQHECLCKIYLAASK